MSGHSLGNQAKGRDPNYPLRQYRRDEVKHDLNDVFPCMHYNGNYISVCDVVRCISN
jgi:hypothetical protein